jgi:hypothetical protein
MRCDELIQELARLRGEAIPDGAAEHLARCPSCASWAEQKFRLDRLWEATRPDEPPAAVWEAVWSRVTEAADAPPAPPLRPVSPAHPWRRAAIAAMVIAQAAAILLGAMLLLRQGGSQVQLAKQVPPPSPLPEAVVSAAIPLNKVDIDFNQTVCIQSNRREVRVLRVEPEENSNSVDSSFVMLGILEAMAE